MPLKVKSPIGIYGGTFDPVHYGHLRPNLELCEIFALDHVRFIPAFAPPHREAPQTPAEQRLEMVAQAIEAESRFVLDDREIKRGGPSYTLDTLKSLRQDYPDNPLCLLMGMDAFAAIDCWYHWQELLDYAHIIVSQRPETDFHASEQWSTAVQALYEQHQAERKAISQTLCGKIRLEPVTQLSISATDIRNRLKNKQSIRFLMPEPVINLIKYYNLYT
ncbi:MAG: nicotinate-nucleotide adenylyltransferase [gamma proteobacterium symbiont of Bathyaustriella thionipta]|nr:nicotinate-nucleotide adenylyltransferase [gamma proteobacterium symbiont of Bathyaustriella thionipta]MCU7951470.1 nicotinate-nucleotide adenylyltransferase [gamma proteobacterium symbiont of Bathyaustriella thionipta]MCU7954895.1 nicotinate-nucleotide adenylyltransferase [gamma proteobacterium symbiont of Bathyaustriella thionipta]MCU7958038.1 nicotinate-nucleotide adenylyltransferase [gamma proteobacterium symbiont of Bathyaustriella thionipta]MCU7968683.1 nicotinate-nucleotide adenylyltr